MKSIYATFSLMLITVLACKKTEVTSGVASGFTGVIDGQQWVATDSSISASLLSGIITVSGKSNDGQTITILLNDTITGTYTLNENSISIATYFDLQDNSTLQTRYLSTDQNANASLSGGTVTVKEIDKINKTISGIFSFNAYIDSANYGKTIREGVFTRLPYINSLPPAAATDSFEMQINGAVWNAQSVHLTNVNGFFLITGSSLDASKSVGIYVFIDPCSNCDSINYLSYFIGQFNDGKVSEFNAFGSPNSSLLLLEYNLITRRLRGQFNFDANSVSRSINRVVPEWPPPSQGNFIYYDPSAQPVVLSNGYFSIGF